MPPLGIVYQHSLLDPKPNGIISYLRSLITYVDAPEIIYWSPSVEEGILNTAGKTLHMCHLDTRQSIGASKRLTNMQAVFRARWQIVTKSTPVIVNVNEHATALMGSGVTPRITYISHGSNDSSLRQIVGTKAYLWNRLNDYVAVQVATNVIVVSRQALAVFHGRYPRLARKIHYCPTFVPDHVGPLDRMSQRLALGIPDEELVICYAGRLSKEKRVADALMAFHTLVKEIPKSRFLVLGDGPERVTLGELTRTLNLNDKVHFWGDVVSSDVIRALSASDVAVLLSSFEGISIFMLESLACGIPLVASDVADHKNILEKFMCGLVVPPNAHPSEVSNAIVAAHRQRNGLSRNALKASQQFRASEIVPQIEKIVGLH